MADNLDILNAGTEDNLSALVGDEEQGPKGHEPSNKNMAAFTALMSQNPLENYQRIQVELRESGQSLTQIEIEEQAKARAKIENQKLLATVLADPTLSDEQKSEAINKTFDNSSELYEPKIMMATDSLAADSGYETIENEVVRFDMASKLQKVNDYQKKVQYLLNEEIAKSDTNLASLSIDFVELLLPLTEQARLNEARNELVSTEDKRGVLNGLVSLQGKTKAELRDAFRTLPIDQQFAFAQKLVEAVNETGNIAFIGKNELGKVEYLKSVLQDGYYTDVDEFIDNSISVIDWIGVGSALKTVFKKGGQILSAAGKGVTVSENLQSIWKRRFGTKEEQPTAPAETVRQTNPEQSRNIHEAVRQSEGDEAADALYGASREDAIAGDILPDPVTDTARQRTPTPHKLSEVAEALDPTILDRANKDGKLYYFDDELKRMRSHVYTDFKSIAGVRMLDEMSQVGLSEDGKFMIRAIYGNREGAFASAQDAYDLALFNLRKYGVGEDEITIMKKSDEGEFVPVEGIPEGPGAYVAKIDYKYDVNVLDIEEMSKADVKWNLFDRIKWPKFLSKDQGSMQRHILDSHSMLHPTLTLGANVSVDRAAGLESLLLSKGREFSDKYVKLAPDRRELLDDYIREANHVGLALDRLKLEAEGFTKQEIHILEDWRSYWDTMYVLENQDMAKTLRSRGFQVLEDPSTDTRLFIQPLSTNSAKKVKTVYNADTQKLELLDANALEEMYEQGTVVGKMREPMNVDGRMVEHIMVKESVEGSRVRRIRDDDKILNYRQGYYTVQYDAPRFIVKEQVVDGQTIRKTVAVAGDIKAADKYIERLAKEELDPNVRYYQRDDIKKMDMGSDEYWSLQSASGRTAQRVRGRRLEDADQLHMVSGENSYVKSPVDSMVNAARSVATRVSMRDYMETTKQRFLKQFSDILARDDAGNIVWPKNVDEIRAMASEKGIKSKQMADAVTTYEYIRYLENGYRNALDDGSKAFLRGIANIVGEAGMAKFERAARKAAEGRGVAGFSKNIAFQAYLATNPLRQIIVQSHQATLLAANFPGYVASQRLARDTGGVLLRIAKIKNAPGKGKRGSELDQMAKEFQESGLLASVDRQNLIEGSITEMVEGGARAERNILVKGGSKALQQVRKLGFDAGETVNILTSFLAHRDEMVKKVGRFNLTQRELDEVVAKARNYTFNMNFAGDMPYNQNFLNLIFQFFQVPHKALTQMFTNRVLTKKEKLKLGTYQMAMFTLPPATMYNLFGDQLADLPEETREILVQGLEGYFLNKAANLVFEEPGKTDFYSLAPVDMYGTAAFLQELLTLSPLEAAAQSPSGQLFFSSNARITEAMKTLGRYINPTSKFHDSTDAEMVLRKAAEISSGMSNIFKAKVALKEHVMRNGTDVVDDHVTTGEAFFKLFGLSSMDETLEWNQRSEQYAKSKAFRDDVIHLFKEVDKHLALQGVDAREEDYYARAIGFLFGGFEGAQREAALEIWDQELQRKARDGDSTMMNNLLKKSGMMTNSEIRSMIIGMPGMSEEQKQAFIKIFDDVDKIQKMEDL